MTRRLCGLAALLWLVLAPGAALADKRVALLIGNAGYAAVPRLSNPANDVAVMKAAFESAGFDSVETAFDLTRDGMVRSLRAFEDRTAGADIAVVYYSGHGMEMGGENYLVPVDATLKSDRDVADETVTLDRVLRAVEGAKRLKLVILDACRDNPFLAAMALSSGRTRSVTRGLARVEPGSANTLVAFAAKGGTVALDGDGANSPFAAALAVRLVAPGTEVEIALRQVRDDVLKATANRQEPFKYGSLGGDPIMLSKQTVAPAEPPAVSPAAPPAAAQAPAGDACSKADIHWAQAEKFDTIALYETHLKFFGNCAYADFARARIEALRQRQATLVPAAPPPSPPAEQPASAATPPPEQPADLHPSDPNAFDPTPLLPVALAPADRKKLVGFEGVRRRSVDAALALGESADVAALRQIVVGERQAIGDDKVLLGKWRCRSAQIDDGTGSSPGEASVYAYPYFRCAITRQGGNLFLAKTNGSQRLSGTLYRVGQDQFAFVGAAANGDDPETVYGASAEKNLVAYLFKVGPNRLRLELPNTCCSSLEILEFVK